MLTGEMFYNELNLDPNDFISTIAIEIESGDTLKTELWNNRKGSLIINSSRHLKKLDKNKRHFLLQVNTDKITSVGHFVFCLVLENKNATKETNLINFINNAKRYRQYYSHGAI